jgi:hypothetical protein
MDSRFRSRFGALAQIAPLAPAAFAVHQLRYLLAYGGGASAELQRTGHSYLHSLVPWLVLILALCAGAFLRSLGRAFAGQTSLPRYTLSLAGMWMACTVALIGIFACQELLEGLFTTGHAAGLAGVFGFGGGWAIPASLCIGLVLAAWLHGARWVVRAVASRRAGRPMPAAGHPALVLRYPRLALLTPPQPLIDGSCSRGPPAR